MVQWVRVMSVSVPKNDVKFLKDERFPSTGTAQSQKISGSSGSHASGNWFPAYRRREPVETGTDSFCGRRAGKRSES